jgi:hypothetical protein
MGATILAVLSILAMGCAGAGHVEKRGACVAECESTNERCVVSAPDANETDKCDEERAVCVESCP